MGFNRVQIGFKMGLIWAQNGLDLGFKWAWFWIRLQSHAEKMVWADGSPDIVPQVLKCCQFFSEYGLTGQMPADGSMSENIGNMRVSGFLSHAGNFKCCQFKKVATFFATQEIQCLCGFAVRCCQKGHVATFFKTCICACAHARVYINIIEKIGNIGNIAFKPACFLGLLCCQVCCQCCQF